MVRPEPAPAQRHGPKWLVSCLLLIALGIALWGLSPMLSGSVWWLQGILVAAVVLGGAVGVRYLAARRIWGTVAAVGIAVAAITLLFAAPTAFLGVIPTTDTFDALHELEAAGFNDIATQRIPADATDGLRFLICVGVAAIAVVMDAFAHLLRVPAFTGLPLLILLLVPSLVQTNSFDLAPFVLTALAWLAALAVSSSTSAPRTAVGVGAAAVAVALIVPIALPAGEQAPPEGGSGIGTGFAIGLNPVITLGDDLRRGEPSVALTYETSDDAGQYLRMTALDDFTGESWSATNLPEPGADVGEMGPAPGLGDSVAVERVTTDVEISGVLSRWLPVTYAAEEIRELSGDWSWEPDALTVRSDSANARDQTYAVESVEAEPSVEQLIASGSGPYPDMERYLALPDELPEIVRTTAQEIAADATSHYEIAVELQRYFRNGTFTYSEETPVDEDFDGSGAEVLGPFLEVRAGYCVHFSSAMAAMARSLGIPARVVVGFTPGEAFTTGESNDDIAHRVSTDNLHAWPELYFQGIGWMRFEPTPGRGSPPVFAPSTVDDPATPEVDESVPPPPEPLPSSTPGSTTAPTEAAPDPITEAQGPDATSAAIPWQLLAATLAILLLITPAVIRAARRGRRLGAVGRGSAVDAWDELRDTAYDLGLATDITRTPRQLASDLEPHLDGEGIAALASVRASLESQAFAREGRSPTPHELRRVLASLRRVAGLPRTLAATFAPRSLVRTWIQLLAER